MDTGMKMEQFHLVAYVLQIAVPVSRKCPIPSCRIRCLIPVPLLCLVVAFKLYGGLRSQVTSTLLVLANCLSIYGITFISA